MQNAAFSSVLRLKQALHTSVHLTPLATKRGRSTMASSYRVNLLDVLRTQANSEQENRKRVLRVYGGLMALTHALDVCAAVALVACYGGFEAKAALRPFERWDFAFGHKITDVFFMALARAIVFPLLTRLAVRCGRRDGCLCAKKPAAPEGYAALEGEERTGAAAAAALSADLADKDRQRQKAHAAARKHAILGLLFVLATGMQVQRLRGNQYSESTSRRWRGGVAEN